MSRIKLVSAALVILMLPMLAQAMTESKSGFEYPDQVIVGSDDAPVTLKGTGTALREKTFLKVDVYTIASYIDAAAELQGDPAAAILELNAPKRLRMDLRRSFSKDKLTGAFQESIEKNYDDMSAFSEDMNTFFGYFTRDAEEGDVILFDYCPATGLTTTVNDEVLGVITNFEFTKAMWTVWFGKNPVDKGMRKNMMAELSK